MERLTIKRGLGSIWPASTKNRKVILLYHSVGTSPWATDKYQFIQQINWLHDHCQLLSLTQLIHAKPSDQLQIALTFDDGYQTLYDQVAPLLSAKKIPALVYINTGWIADNVQQRKASAPNLGHYPNEYFLTWDEVAQLEKNTWEIGSHGVNHDNFTTLQKTTIQQELIESKRHIQSHLNKECSHFSYPFGRYTHSVKTAVKNAGYQFATAARHGKLSAHSDILALPRMNIAKEYSFTDFKSIVLGKWDYLGLFQKIKGL
jgi:peptidoglycan/xylan/chitin deacetylase (PgdA/CDA1 family)